MLKAVGAIGFGTAATVAAVLLFGWLVAPAPRYEGSPVTDPAEPPVAAGAFHVHTRRSDGTGTADQIAEAARRAGLQFVVFADHGDGTRRLDPPTYRSGVLCLDGVEISTEDGHYVATDIERAPYPLAGEARDVIEDVSRLGGFGVAAHPVSRREQLRWREWTAPFDGLEWLNADSEWRDERATALGLALLTYAFRPVETLASLLDRPELGFARWDALARRRRIVALAGADAHARLSLFDEDQRGSGAALFKLPSYEALFRTFAVRVLLDRPLSGDAGIDGRAVLASIRQGRVYTLVDGIAAAAPFSFSASSGGQDAEMGSPLAVSGPVRLRADVKLPPGGQIVLVRDGTVVAETDGSLLEFDGPAEPAVYRVEVHVAGAPGSPPIPWIVSNPVYVGFPPAPLQPPPRRAATSSLPLVSEDEGHTLGWRVEHDPSSNGELTSVPSDAGRALIFRATLGEGPDQGQTSALARYDFGGLAGYDRVTLTARADRPLRLSVQMRLSEGEAQQRWQRSVYLGREVRTVTIFFDEMRPVGRITGRPPLDVAQTLLFALDTVNTPPGTGATIWLEEVSLGKSQ